MGEDDDARPVNDEAGREQDRRQAASSRQAYRRRLSQRADLALRCAWLTVHAELMYGVDEGGLLSAQLLDLRDLLWAEDEGRWAS